MDGEFEGEGFHLSCRLVETYDGKDADQLDIFGTKETKPHSASFLNQRMADETVPKNSYDWVGTELLR